MAKWARQQEYGSFDQTSCEATDFSRCVVHGTNNTPQPIVYYYNDHNGTYEEYQKIPIALTTTGICADWSFYKSMAKHLADRLNEVEFGEIRE